MIAHKQPTTQATVVAATTHCQRIVIGRIRLTSVLKKNRKLNFTAKIDVQESSSAIVSSIWALLTVSSIIEKDRFVGSWPWKIIASIIYKSSVMDRYKPMHAVAMATASRRKPSSTKRRFWYFRRRAVRAMAARTETANRAIVEPYEIYQSWHDQGQNAEILPVKQS